MIPLAHTRSGAPLSFGQQRLWFADQLEPGSVAYNVPCAVKLTGVLDVGVLQSALAEIVARHEVLRTTFDSVHGVPVQRVHAAGGFRLPVLDLMPLPERSREAEVGRLVTADALMPFDLSTGPLMRAQLLKLSGEQHVLAINTHHAATDGWSIVVLFRELARLYQAFAAGRPSPLAALPIQYVDYAVWQRQELEGPGLDKSVNYWKRQLAGCPVLQLPLDRPRQAGQSSAAGRHQCLVPAGVVARLQPLLKTADVTTFMMLLAAFQAVLHRYTGSDDIVVGTDVANRHPAETRRLLGFFVNQIALRVDCAGDPTFRELLRRVREATLGGYAHQQVPFEKVVEALRPKREAGLTPLFQVLFVFDTFAIDRIAMAGVTFANWPANTGPLKYDSWPVDTGTSKFDLAVFAHQPSHDLTFDWRWRTAVFDDTTILRMADRYLRLLADAAARPDARLSELAFLSEAGRSTHAMDADTRKASQRSKFLGAKPQAVRLDSQRLVTTGYLQPDARLPLVIQPGADPVRLAEWAAANREYVGRELLAHGALLFRGFDIASPVEFERFASALAPELFGEYGDLPREGLGGRVYGSTPYPADQTILFHNESSHMHRWPMKIWFFCVTAAERGGETPIVDGREMYRRLDATIRRRFAERRLMYVRNYIEGLDVAWPTFFGTADKAAVEACCRDAGIDFEWRPDGGLRTRQVCPGVIRHPLTKELAWFNQVQLHHPWFLEAGLRASLLDTLAPDDLPRNVLYGDGAPIEDSVMEEIDAVYRQTAVASAWRAGDVMMLDNMLVAHGRNPFVGPRKIVVAMAEMMNQSDLPELAL